MLLCCAGRPPPPVSPWPRPSSNALLVVCSRLCSFYRLVMDVRSIDWQLYLFRERQERMQLRLARILAVAQPDAQFHAWNDNQDLVVAVSKYARNMFPGAFP